MRYPYSCAVVALCALFVATACNPIADWEENPAQVRAKAEITGSATIYIYFAVDQAAIEHAAGLREVVKVIKGIATSFPEEGFVSLLPLVNVELKKLLIGDKAVYLPPAQLLSQVLLVELQRKAEKDHWLNNEDAVADIITAFLSGADTALASYAATLAIP